MICRFESSPTAAAPAAGAGCPGAVSPAAGAQGPPLPAPSAVAGVSAMAPSAVAGETAATPLTPVLARLVGREVKVIAGYHCYSGRVLQSNPLTLIGPSGEVMIIAQAPSSVQY